ncbi:MAG: hypothetical protein K9J16_12005 [Melioribacteraceae bacterium]|nr:hypothetical protein [Melioribacteraceae bacterium]MCF8354139.1 hypothetical protein [Melioribacteraceae bacterium]MCF8393366.1 hypothetical protein [Melioribacteraceae bacterium]MCF8418931.1 hypothetical protein [Melioribacteraceae bacterium]
MTDWNFDHTFIYSFNQSLKLVDKVMRLGLEKNYNITRTTIVEYVLS